MPAITIAPPDFMRWPETIRLMQALNAEATQALFVGGCVRNAVLEREIKDVDLATLLTPQTVQDVLAQAGIKTIPTGIDHGTVTAVIGNKTFEITTLRRDVETDGRHAVIDFSDDWVEDAARRDFTMNTLLADMEGNIFDPLGQGIDDLKAGRVRFVGTPAQRIREDYLRILRFFRFHAWYGERDMDAEGLAACQENAAGIATLSKERVTHEFLKILAAQGAADILEIIIKNSVLDIYFKPEYLHEFIHLQQKFAAFSLMARLSLIETGELLLLSNAQKNELAMLEKVKQETRGVKYQIYHFGKVITLQHLLLRKACGKDVAETDLTVAQEWTAPVFPMSGEDLLAQGYKPGPELGARLRELEEEWMRENF